MKIGDRILTKHTGLYGTVVTEPEILLGTKQVGIKFDNPEYNELFDPYYIPTQLLEVI